MPVNKTKNSKTPAFTKDCLTREYQLSPAIVRVRWLDACKSSSGQLVVEPGWREGYEPGVYMETVGYLLYSDESWVTIAMERSVSAGKSFRDWQDIPRYSIAEFEVLKEAQKAKRKEVRN